MTAAPMSGRALSVAEAAKVLGISTGRVRELARAGRLDVVSYDSKGWLLDAASVKERANRPRPQPLASWLVPVRPHAGTLPAEPLLRLVAARGGPAACGVRQRSAEERALQRARKSGLVTLDAADNLAVRVLGLTPWEIWNV